MSKLFLSYARKDIHTVTDIYERLIDAGYSVWMDTRRIKGGRQWRVEIVEAIEDSQVFVISISSNSTQSANVLKELCLAESMGKLIVPVMIDDVDLPVVMKYQLAGIESLDFGQYFISNFQKILKNYEINSKPNKRDANVIDRNEEDIRGELDINFSTDEVFRWQRYEIVIRSILLPKYLWFAANTTLYIAGEAILVVVSGIPKRNSMVAFRTLNGQDFRFELVTKNQYYTFLVNGIEIKKGIAPLKNRYWSFLGLLLISPIIIGFIIVFMMFLELVLNYLYNIP